MAASAQIYLGRIAVSTFCEAHLSPTNVTATLSYIVLVPVPWYFFENFKAYAITSSLAQGSATHREIKESRVVSGTPSVYSGISYVHTDISSPC